jgi:hypothetical protein
MFWYPLLTALVFYILYSYYRLSSILLDEENQSLRFGVRFILWLFSPIWMFIFMIDELTKSN